MAITKFNVENGLSVGTGSIDVIDSTGAGTFTNVVVSGNLTVLGSQTIVSSSIVEIGDNVITLNASSTPANFGGIYVNDINLNTTGSFIWDSFNNVWLAGLKGSEAALPNGSGTGNYLVKWSGALGGLLDSIVYDNGTNVGIGTNNTGDKLAVAGTLSVTGSLRPGADLSYSLGSSSKRWLTVHASALTGSLTRLSDGTSYLVAGPNMVITTGSNGAVTLEAVMAGGTISGAGTINYVPKFSGASSVTDSSIFDNGSSVGIGITDSGDRFAVNGSASITGSLQPGLSATYDLGSSGKKWRTLYASSVVGDLTGSNLSVGSVLYANSTGGITGSQSTLYWDPSTSRLGVGTSSPTSTLTVTGASDLNGNVSVGGNIAVNGTAALTGSVLPGTTGLYNLGSSTKKWNTVYASSLSGSLTTLADGTPYLLAGQDIQLTTGSNGAVTIAFSGIVGDITSVTAGTGLTGGGSTGAVSLAINDSVVATVSGTTFTGVTKHNAGLSGSLTRLTDGSSYLIGGTGVSATTGSNGSITLSVLNSVVATVSGTTFTGATRHNAGLSGSLTKLTDGTSYLVAGNNVTITTGSNGAITIESTAGGTLTGDGEANFITKWAGGTSLTGSKIFDSGTEVRVLVPMSLTGTLLPGVNSSYNLGSVTKAWSNVYSTGFSGSLTSLVDGSPYLVAGTGISITTGSNGSITINGNVGDITGVTAGTGLTGGGSSGNVTLDINDAIVATVSGTTFTGAVKFNSGLSGSLTKLADGSSYLIAGSGVTLTTGSSGAITIDVSGGGGSGLVDGNGTLGKVARWSDTNTLTDSVIYDNGSTVGIGTSSGGDTFTVSGSMSLTGSLIPGVGNLYALGDATKPWSSVFATSLSSSNLRVSGETYLTGSVTPGLNATYDLGSTSRAWRNFYASNISGSLTGSGLDAGSILFASTGGLVSGSNSRLYWDNSNGRLGIGTSSPQNLVEVTGVSGSLFNVSDSMSGSLFAVTSIASIPIFEVFSDYRIVAGGYNTNALVISGATVGVGTSNISSRLFVAGTSNSSWPVAVLQAGTATPTAKVFDVRNSGGTSVASIDYLGNVSGSTGVFTSGINAPNGTFTGNLVVSGNFTVLGTQTVISSTQVNIGDNIILLNSVASPAQFGGIYVADTTVNTTGSFIWDSSTDRWKAGLVGNEINIVTTGSTDSLFNKTLTLSGSTRNFITGGTPNTVLFFDATGSLSSSSGLTYNSSTGFLTASTFFATSGLSGSLTKLTDGTSYLVAGPNVIIQTGSNGAVTITATSSGGSGGSAVGGSGTANYIPKWTTAVDIADSLLYDDGNSITVGMAGSGDTFAVNGSVSITGSLLPGVDDIYNLGSAAKRWNTVFADNISGSLTGSGLQTGSVIFAGPGGLLTGSNTQLFWSVASSSLGIGTNNPAGKLEVYSTASGSLFAVTDTLSGSLLSVNTISGLAAFEVFSDYRVFAGSPAANALVVNSTTVGIGTSTPTSRFQVIGTTSTTTPTAIIRAGVASPTAPVLDVQTSTGTPVFTVSGSGNVGIGTAVISYALDVWPSTATARIGQGLMGTWPNTSTFAMFGHSSLSHVSAANYAMLQSSVGDTFVNAASTKTLYLRIANADIAAVTATGVGIGTTTPGFSLQLGNNTSASTASPQTISLGGTFSNTAGSNLKLRLWTDGTSVYGLGVSNNQLDYSVATSGNHVWYIAGTEYVRINTTGLGLGTNNPGFRLQLGNNTGTSTATPETINMGGTFSNTAGSNVKLRLYNDGTNVSGISVSSNQLEYVAHSGVSHVWFIGGTERVRLNASGNVGIGTGTYTARFHVSGSSTSTSSTAVLREGVVSSTSDARALDVQRSSGTSLFWVSGSGTNYFSGSVGIGVTQPTGPLQVMGTSGSLFLVTDSITGSLFSVNNVTGLPIFEVFSDNRIVAGRYGQNTFVVSGSRIAMGANPVNDIELLISGSSASGDEVLVVRAGVPSPTGTLIEAQTFNSSSVFWVSGSGNAFFSGSVRANAFSGSLTKLSNGSDYLVAGAGILLVTQSNGSILITGSSASNPGGLTTYVQFNDAGILGGDANFTFNKTTDTLTVTNLSGSLTKLSNGSDYLVAGSNISLSTGSNGSITINAAVTPYTTASFTNVTSLTINHNLGITLYDIEVFDTSYNKIFPKSATATSTTQANITFGLPTSGYVTVGGSGGGGGGGVTSLTGLSTDISTTGQITGSLVYSTGLITGSSLTTTGGITAGSSIVASGPITGSLVASTSTVTAMMPFFLGNINITSNYTVPSGSNAMTPGPITIADGVTVTVSDGSTWTVV